MLRLLQSAQRRDDPRDAENGRALLGSLADLNPLLTWEYLVEHHWIRVVWGRWHVPYGLPERASEDQNELGKEVVRTLAHLKKRGREKPVLAVPDAARILSEHRSAHPAAPSIATLVDEGILVCRVGEMFLAPHCAGLRARGSWIAARLWDRTDAGPRGAPRLAWWRDRILGLGFEWFNFGGQLAATERDQFVRLAWQVVLEEADLHDWHAERERMAVQIAANSGLGVAERGLEVARECPESDPVDQLLWVRWASLADVNQEERSEVGALVSLILRWKTAFRSREPWEGWIDALVTAVQDRPYLLYAVDCAVHRDPITAADLLRHPKAAALGLVALLDYQPAFGPSRHPVGEATALVESVWRDVAEAAALSLYSLEGDVAATHIGAVLSQFAGMAAANAADPRTRARHLQFKYRVLRAALTRWPAVSGNAIAFDRVGGGVVEALARKLRAVPNPIASTDFGLLASLVALEADDASPWASAAVAVLMAAYGHGMRAEEGWHDEIMVPAEVWTSIARRLVAAGTEAWDDFIRPVDFAAMDDELAETQDERVYVRRSALLHKVRTHLRLLFGVVENWGNAGGSAPALDRLETVLQELLSRWLLPAPDRDRVSIIAADIDIEYAFQPQRESLVVGLAKAIPKLSEKARKVIGSLVITKMTEVRQLAAFIDAAPPCEERETARVQLRNLAIFEGTANIESVVEAQRAIESLLRLGENDRAEVWLEKWAEKGRSSDVRDWIRWEVGVHQRLRLAREQYDAAASASLPDWAGEHYDNKRTNDFFRGIALMRVTPARNLEAVVVYQGLVSDAPENPSYAVNLFAAKTQLLLEGTKSFEPGSERERVARDLLLQGETEMSRFAPEQRLAIEHTYQVNRIAIFHQLGEWSELLSAYQRLPESMRGDEDLLSSAAVALEASGQEALAVAMRTGSVADGPSQNVSVPAEFDVVAAARVAILRLPQLSMHEQGRALWDLDVWQGVLRIVLDGCVAMAELAPLLARPNVKAPAEEDRITELLAALLRQRTNPQRWSVSSQEHAGYTAKDPSKGRGGLGERDLEIRCEAAHVAVGEAILLKSFDATDLIEHFQRLFAYTPAGTPLPLLLIWSYGSAPSEIWKRYLHDIAQERAPSGHEFERWLVPDEGPSSHVWHAVSEHRHPEAGSCRVAHVLVDLEQHSRRTVGVTSRTRASH